MADNNNDNNKKAFNVWQKPAHPLTLIQLLNIEKPLASKGSQKSFHAAIATDQRDKLGSFWISTLFVWLAFFSLTMPLLDN